MPFTKKTSSAAVNEAQRKALNQFHTTDNAEWLTHYKGFRLQIPEESQDNIERGNHEEPILDNIFKVIKFVCSRHNEVTVLRFDYYPADSGISITNLLQPIVRRLKKERWNNGIRTTKKTEGESIYRDLQYLWVREKGKSRLGKGIHFHCFMAFRKVDRMTIKQLYNNFRDIVAITLSCKDESDIDTSKKKVVNPYVAIKGFFVLERKRFTVESQEQQRICIERLIAEDKGCNYLNINAIKTRKHTQFPIGGYLDECIYALSYMSKVVTKEHLPKGQKKHGRSELKCLPNLSETRIKKIAVGAEEVERAFKNFESREVKSVL